MYKKNNLLEKRCKESENILKKYPNRIPVIVERSEKCKEINDIDKNKFLVPNDLTMNQFIYVIRKRLKLSSEKALFVFINDKLMPNSRTLHEIYQEEKEEDDFLYMKYASENTFG